MTTEPSNPVIHLSGPQNAAGEGLRVASEALALVAKHRRASIDCSDTERMTPSFANALIFTLAEALGVDAVQSSVDFELAQPHVREAIAASLDRYRRGVRLSTQRPALPDQKAG